MTKVIVEENGKRRGFKVGKGRLSIGSGESAKLKLASEDVAELHAEIQFADDGRATLTCRPGVMPAKVRGVQKKGAIPMQHGVPVQLGAAQVKIEYDDEALQGGGAKARSGSSAGARPVTRSGARGGGRSSSRRGAEDDEERPRRAARKQGPPTMLIVFPLLAIAVVVGFFGLKTLLSTERPTGVDSARAYYNNAMRKFGDSQWDEAAWELSRIGEDDPVSPELAGLIQKLERDIAEQRVDSVEREHNAQGDDYLNTQLRKYESAYLKGVADRPKVRVFLKRCAVFVERWPTHSERGWVDRQIARYEGVVDLNQPPDYDDIAWEVKTLTWANPRDYKQAFQVLERFIDTTADPDQRSSAEALVQEKVAERAEWFDDRMQQARFEYDNGNYGKSVRWLVTFMKYTGDDEMATQAARRLVEFGSALGTEDVLKPIYRGYRNQEPDTWTALLNHPITKEHIDSLGID